MATSELPLPIPAMFLQIGQRRYSVASFEQASQMFERARDACGEGASKTPTPLIVDETGAVIAHLSYNGRVWPGREWAPDVAPLFDNCPNKFTAKYRIAA